MGRPFDIIESPGEAEETDSSSSEDEAAGSGDDEGWVVAHEAEDVWDDPSHGMLAQVFDAAEAGDAAGLADLLQGLQVSLDTRGADSDTAIHLAALYGHTDCVRLLLDKGARADVADADGALPLHDASAGGYTRIVEMLLDASPDAIDRGDSEGDTALHNAARGSHAEVLELLVSRGADVALQNDDFKTPLQLAEHGSRAREVLEEAERCAAAAGDTPQLPPPAVDIA